MKQYHAQGYVSTYNVEIINSFNPELQIKDTESAVSNKLKDLLTELKGFKFMTALVLKLESEMKKI